jgi:hypothetical protein
LLSKEDPLRRTQRFGHSGSVHLSPHDGDEPFVVLDGVGELQQATPRLDRIGADDEDERVGPLNASIDAREPLFGGPNVF